MLRKPLTNRNILAEIHSKPSRFHFIEYGFYIEYGALFIDADYKIATFN